MTALRVVRGWTGLPDHDRGAAVAMGNFDGVHLGHQAVIALAASVAAELGAPLGVVTFDPHPSVYFGKHDRPAWLTTPEQQARALEALGVDVLYVLPLGAELANMGAGEFAARVLWHGLGVGHVAVGFDNTFGKDRGGNPATLRDLGRELGFGVSVAEAVTDREGVKLSSTAAREALRNGRPELAALILGRPFGIEGVVRHGPALRRALGLPIVNVALPAYTTVKPGLYVARTRLADGREFPSVAYVARRHAANDARSRLMEVWIADFDEDLYGQTIETDLMTFLPRPDRSRVRLEISQPVY
jgi:riboflavin kinase / FMN adenylyltransferase